MCWPHELAGKFEAGTNAMPPPHRGGFLLIEQSRVLSYAPRRHCQRADVWPATSKLSSFRIVGKPEPIHKRPSGKSGWETSIRRAILDSRRDGGESTSSSNADFGVRAVDLPQSFADLAYCGVGSNGIDDVGHGVGFGNVAIGACGGCFGGGAL